ncbi:MAG: hypothetical protein WAO58_00595 [Fimbriimonadaceae bacterium]
MKARFLLIPVMLAAYATAGQDSIKIIRTFKEGEKDVYDLTMKMASQMGAVDLTMTTTQTVKKIYPNGDADIENATGAGKINIMGQARDIPAGKSTTMRMNKFGAPVDAPKASGGQGMNLDFINHVRGFGDYDLKLNVPVTIDFTDPKDAKSKVKGTVMLIALSEKTATVKADLSVWNAMGGPIKMIATSVIDRASGKGEKVEVKAEKLPAEMTGGFPIESMELTLVRKAG